MKIGKTKARLHLIKYFYFLKWGMAKCVEKLNRLATTVLDNILVEWFRQDYGNANYEDSAIGLAGAAILKTRREYSLVNQSSIHVYLFFSMLR